SSDVGQDNWAFTAMLVVNDFPENLAAVTNLLDELDVPPKQVLIESTILQTTLNEKNAFGIDFSIVSSLNFTDLTNPLNAVNDLISGGGGASVADHNATALTQTVANVADAGTFKLGVIRDDASVFLRVLDQVSDLTVLARPKVMCLNRQRAEVLVGRRVGYLSTTATETSSTQTVEFLDTGIHLMFRPFIASDGMIRLELAPSVSDFVLREVAGSGASKVTIPDEVTNELTTNVRVHDGNTLVLGGLFRESNDVKRRQVPILGDIPIVGAAFRGQDDEVKLDEIIFLITPSVVHDELAWAVGNSALGYSDALLVGSRQGLLPFSRQRMTVGYNARAQDAFDRGQLDQALHFVNDSLRLNSMQPRAQRLRDQIMQMREPDSTIGSPYERNILEGIMRSELGPLGTSVSNTPATGEGFEDFPSFDELFNPAINVDPTPDNTPTEIAEATEEPLSSAQDLDEAADEMRPVQAPLQFESVVVQKGTFEIIPQKPAVEETAATDDEIVAFDAESESDSGSESASGEQMTEIATAEPVEQISAPAPAFIEDPKGPVRFAERNEEPALPETVEEMTVASVDETTNDMNTFEVDQNDAAPEIVESENLEMAAAETETAENELTENLFEVANELAAETEAVAANTAVELTEAPPVEPAKIVAAQPRRMRRSSSGWGSGYRRPRVQAQPTTVTVAQAPVETTVEETVEEVADAAVEIELAGPERLVMDDVTVSYDPNFFHNTGVSTYPELQVPGWPPIYDTPRGQTLVATDPLTPEDRDRLTDRLVSEYFTSLGISRLTQYPRKEEDDDEQEFALPSITFDDMFNDLLEEMQQGEGVAEVDTEATFIED
ncbi:MAG: hypothetical protein GY715_16940, partial [Planctomycetes bacterium]|nr:hypothetical protein [Planctomycetota bacterium]